MNNRVVFITGGLSGIGKDICEAFLNAGAHVYTNYITDDEAHRTQCNALKSKYADFYAFIADVTVKQQVQEILNYIKQREGLLDILVNNAGISINDNAENFDIDSFKQVIDTNLCGKALVAMEAVDLLAISSSPRIINIASRLATRPKKDSIAYCCAAAGITMFTRVAALELAKYGIRVNCVSPSLTLTPMSLESYTQKEITDTIETNPCKRLCTTDDIINTIFFLCSDKSDFINGSNIDVNGGVF